MSPAQKHLSLSIQLQQSPLGGIDHPAGAEGVQGGLPRGGGLRRRFGWDILGIVLVGREVRRWNRPGCVQNKWMWSLGSQSGLGSAVGELMINDLRSFSSLNESIIHQKQLLHVVTQLSELSTLSHSWCNSGSGGAAEPQTWHQSSPNHNSWTFSVWELLSEFQRWLLRKV